MNSAARRAPSEEWECFDGLFGFSEARELRAGVLDRDAEHVFTSGHCHSFAEAIRRLNATAELAFAFNYLGEEGEEGAAQGHVLARIAGRYLDARGWVDERLASADANRAFEDEWDRVIEIGPQGWLANSSGWLAMRVSDALPFAAALLTRLRIPTNSCPDAGQGREEVHGCSGS